RRQRRLRHGVRRARSARRARPALRQRGGAAVVGGAHRPPRGAGRPARRGDAAGRGGDRRRRPRPRPARQGAGDAPPRSAAAGGGADPNRSGASEVDFSARADRLHGSPEAAALAVETEDRAALLDALILCKFLRGVFDDLYAESADLLARVTGWDVTADELRTTAGRIVTAQKLYNGRERWTAA